VAVKGINFTIEEGEIFGLLGPNGAGKSSAIKMLTCLFPPDDGTARVCGHDVVKETGQVKQLIGVVPQDLALYPTLSGRDNLRFFGEMYGLRGKHLRAQVANVLEYVAMTERAKDPVKTYSGGMKRRINLAAGLIHGPRVLFLDEPTVGVDPQSRNHIFESVERLNREQGMSVLYTTHYMEEAERLCDRIAVMDNGEIIAMDTPKNLIAMLGGGILHLGLPRQEEAWRQALVELSQVREATYLGATDTDVSAEADSETAISVTGPGATGGADGKATLKVETHHAGEALIQIIRRFGELGVEILSIETLEPNLETVFLHLTGKSLRE
jgi:ABC-2 type transport system ATP-binding protein